MADRRKPTARELRMLAAARDDYLKERARPLRRKRFFCVVECECPSCDGRSISRVES